MWFYDITYRKYGLKRFFTGIWSRKNSKRRIRLFKERRFDPAGSKIRRCYYTYSLNLIKVYLPDSDLPFGSDRWVLLEKYISFEMFECVEQFQCSCNYNIVTFVMQRTWQQQSVYNNLILSWNANNILYDRINNEQQIIKTSYFFSSR